MKKYNHLELLIGHLNNHKHPLELHTDPCVLLDTAMDSDNLGDCIIMDACNEICRELMPDKALEHVSTHMYRKEAESLRNKIKIMCGTNIIYQKMEEQRQWVLPKNICSYGQICLLGVGMNDILIDRPATVYTKKLLDAILKPDFIHSVRDSLAEKKLNEMGFHNVINTACPTMWKLTRERIDAVPRTKGRRVVTSVTDYSIDLDTDKSMLEILHDEYEEVFIWPQGSLDFEYILSRICDMDRFHLMKRNTSQLNELLSQEDTDYIGTRLHAGIRALTMGRRTLVITVDNRARQIGLDTGFPTMERSRLKEELRAWINSPAEYDIHIPWDNIDRWKNQFL